MFHWFVNGIINSLTFAFTLVCPEQGYTTPIIAHQGRVDGSSSYANPDIREEQGIRPRNQINFSQFWPGPLSRIQSKSCEPTNLSLPLCIHTKQSQPSTGKGAQPAHQQIAANTIVHPGYNWADPTSIWRDNREATLSPGKVGDQSASREFCF